MARSPASPPSSTTLALAEEWTHLSRRSNHRLDDLLAAAGHRQRGAAPTDPLDDERGELVLRQLVLAAAVDPLAARVVLQRLIPGLIAIARRRAAGRWPETQQALDDLLATGWLVIRTYPVERRRSGVASGLLRDIEYETFVRSTRLRRVTLVPTPVHELDRPVPDEPPSSFDEVVGLLTAARDVGMETADVEFLAGMANGRTMADFAAERRVDVRTERYRRRRVVERTRSALTHGDDPRDVAA